MKLKELQQNENGNTDHLGTVNNPMPFPESTNTLNDCSHPLAQSLTFPKSFPHGEDGGVAGCDRAPTVAREESNKHLLNHCTCNDATQEHACPFAQHDHWTH